MGIIHVRYRRWCRRKSLGNMHHKRIQRILFRRRSRVQHHTYRQRRTRTIRNMGGCRSLAHIRSLCNTRPRPIPTRRRYIFPAASKTITHGQRFRMGPYRFPRPFPSTHTPPPSASKSTNASPKPKTRPTCSRLPPLSRTSLAPSIRCNTNYRIASKTTISPTNNKTSIFRTPAFSV
jgi:hypothetical protein